MQMIQRNVPYGSDFWITETGLLVGPAYQREVRPDNQDHMAAEGLTYQIQKRCVSMHKNTLFISISKFKWNTVWWKKKRLIDKIFHIQDPWWSFHYDSSSQCRRVTACFGWEVLWDLCRLFTAPQLCTEVELLLLSWYLDTQLWGPTGCCIS